MPTRAPLAYATSENRDSLFDQLIDEIADRVAARIESGQKGARMLSVVDAALYAGCTEWTIRRAINLGELPTMDFDKRKRVLREDVDAWIKRNRTQR